MPAQLKHSFPCLALAFAALMLLLAAAGCGAAADEAGDFLGSVQGGQDSGSAPSVQAAPTPTLIPAPTAAMTQESGEDGSGQGTTGLFQQAPLTDEVLRSIVTQNRVIVRTVDMGIIVADVPRSKEDISLLAENFGGWEVSSQRSQRHEAGISVRVPAELLTDFLVRLKNMAVTVEYENSTSQDVTADFVDNEARLRVLRSTEARLLEFHSRAVNVEETVNLEAELSRVQLEIEEIQGRQRFFAETSAYSLVNVALTSDPGAMAVYAGPDATFRAGRRLGFRATFRPPADLDEFKFVWDFGDGSQVVEGSRTAPTANQGERVTATVSHTYDNVQESPYIVRVNIRGIGDSGLFLGSDTLIATVTLIPSIEVFAGEDRAVDEGNETDYIGSFTRPESLWDFRYRWDFGDGSATIFQVPEEGETKAVAKHTYPNHRPQPYPATLTVIAQSEAGEIRGSSSFNVRVNSVEGFIVAGWDIGSTFKSAVRALSVVVQALLTILIWVGIFSPVWLAVILVPFILPRLIRRFGWRLPRLWADPSIPVMAAPSPSPEFPAAPEPGPPAEEEEWPTLLCHNCGATFPARSADGRPAGFCPTCGAEAPSPENNEDRPPNP